MEEKEPTATPVPENAEEQTETAPPESAAEGSETADAEPAPLQLSFEEKIGDAEAAAARLRALVEAAVYITDEPLTAKQIAEALGEQVGEVQEALDQLLAEFNRPEHGLTIREVAEGYKMATKPEHHEAIRAFVKALQKPLKLSMAALETLSVIAYKQPITAPEILEIRGVQGAGVLKTLLDRKLITTAGRKDVVGKPILYKTTKEFLVQFGLKDLKELPTLKEFEELARVALADAEEPPARQVEEQADETTPDAQEAENAPEKDSAGIEERPEPMGPRSETAGNGDSDEERGRKAGSQE